MTEKTARVVRFHETGNSSVLKIEDLPITEPGPDEVRIKVEAFGLNRAEIMFRNGAYLVPPTFPSRIGYEASGTIESIGSNITEFQIGDRVSTIPALSMSEYGVYGESVTLSASAVAKYPANLSAIEGTAIWMQYITAYGALIDIGKLSANQTLLITAASSSVGIAAMQIAKSVGAKIIAATRGPSKVESLIEAGADHVIQTDHENLSEKTLALTNNIGADLVFDPIGGPILEELALATKPRGLIIEYGALDERPTPYPLFTALGKGLIIQGYTLFEITQDTDQTRLNAAIKFVREGLEANKLKPVIDRTFTLDEIQKAHEHLESNQQIGKIVVTV